jgi:hypothetical protein
MVAFWHSFTHLLTYGGEFFDSYDRMDSRFTFSGSHTAIKKHSFVSHAGRIRPDRHETQSAVD